MAKTIWIPESIWYLDEVIPVLRKLREVATAYGYCICLGGGVLNEGFSHNDLDIVCHSHCERHEVADPHAFIISLDVHHGYDVVWMKQAGPHVIVAMEKVGAGKPRVEFWFPYHSYKDGFIRPPKEDSHL